ncbi:hypothetical protein F5883DRAFT_589445, partial [Diaporthe sp. PMI_573]
MQRILLNNWNFPSELVLCLLPFSLCFFLPWSYAFVLEVCLMSPSIFEESAALQALIKANLRVLYPFTQTEVVTYSESGKYIRACVLEVPRTISSETMVSKTNILIEGSYGDSHWGFKESLESVFRKTQELLGSEFQESSATKKI